jgi:hypothetical protein
LSALWEARRSKGVHHTVFRTVFGAIPVDSPRLYHCPCQPHTTTSFSPLAMLLPERTTPDLLYLEPLMTKYRSPEKGDGNHAALAIGVSHLAITFATDLVDH